MDGRQPSTRWYWVAGVLAVVGVIAGILLAVGTFQAYQDDLEGLARSAGGEVRVSLQSDHDAVVFLEGPGVADNEDLRPKVVVTGPEGDPVAVQEYGAELLYDVPGRPGSTGRAIATFDVTVNGAYSVAVDAPAGTTIAVGGGLNVTTLARFVAALVVPALAVLLAIGMAVVAAIMRRSQPPVSTPPQRPRVPAGV
jgi:hypothetical protein